MIDDSMLDHRFVEPECEVIEAEEEEEAKPVTFGRVFAYPANAPGWTMIGLFAGVPFVLILLLFLIPLAPFKMGAFMFGLFIKSIVVVSYLLYLANCIREVADGQLHPPSLFECSEDEDFWGLQRQFWLIASAFIICFGPAFIFLCHIWASIWGVGPVVEVFVTHSGLILLGLLAAGTFLLPMCLLSIVMFDNLGALNPMVIIGSIFSTFFSYLLVVALFFVPIILMFVVSVIKATTINLILLLLLRVLSGYLLMMDAYILGWFFHKNE
ncbi:MAG: hypothetical protein ACYTER_02650, partial [Planctomycetota bacterium]